MSLSCPSPCSGASQKAGLAALNLIGTPDLID
jgi:hypothetical protein